MGESAATRLTELSGPMRGYQALHDENAGDEGQQEQEEGQYIIWYAYLKYNDI